MTKDKTSVDKAYDLMSLLKVLSLAVDGEEISASTLGQIGGGRVLDMAAELSYEILADLERAEIASR